MLKIISANIYIRKIYNTQRIIKYMIHTHTIYKVYIKPVCEVTKDILYWTITRLISANPVINKSLFSLHQV